MSLVRDFKHAARRLTRDWRFTLAAAFTLSLGIGANATVFTIVDALMLRDLPFTDGDRVVSLASRHTTRGQMGIAIRDFEDWRDNAKSVSGMAMWGTYTLNVSDPGRDADRYWGAYTSVNVFKLMGQRPMLGRDFLPDDDKPGATPVAIISHNVWQNRYGSDPTILGRVVKMSEIPATVIGVMPPDMNFPPNTDLWLPIVLMPPAVRNLSRNAHNYGGLARLADGVALQQAQSEFATIGQSLATTYPETNKDVLPSVMTYSERMRGGDDQLILWMLMGSVAFVLLIACANVANLLLARSANRTREVGLRLAIGSPRWRIVRELLAESVLISTIGGLIGVWIGYAGLQLFLGSMDQNWPFWVKFNMDARVIAFLIGVCLLTAILFGLMPALYVSRTDMNSVLKEGGRSGSAGARTQGWAGVLITAELVLTLVLLSGAGLMMRSFMKLYAVDTGFNTSNLLVMSMSLSSRKYPTPDARASFYERLEERLASMPGVRAATVSSHSPYGGWGSSPLVVDGRDATADKEPLTANVVAVGPGYAAAIEVRTTRGRHLAATDGQPGQQHVVVNQDFVTRFLPATDPIGHRIRLGAPGANPIGGVQGGTASDQWHTIVGVVQNVRQTFMFDRENPVHPIVYVPHRTQSFLFARLLVRTATGIGAIAPLIRTELRTIDPDVPIVDMMTMDTALSRQSQGFAAVGTMFSIFAVVALVLAAVGLYAITSHSVVQRTQEIGIRMALGAEATSVWRLFFRRLAVYLGFGLTLGLAGAAGVGALMRNLLVGIGPFDPVTLLSTAAILVIVACIACFWPARTATRVDPMIALRYE